MPRWILWHFSNQYVIVLIFTNSMIIDFQILIDICFGAISIACWIWIALKFKRFIKRCWEFKQNSSEINWKWENLRHRKSRCCHVSKKWLEIWFVSEHLGNRLQFQYYVFWFHSNLNQIHWDYKPRDCHRQRKPRCLVRWFHRLTLYLGPETHLTRHLTYFACTKHFKMREKKMVY